MASTVQPRHVKLLQRPGIASSNVKPSKASTVKPGHVQFTLPTQSLWTFYVPVCCKIQAFQSSYNVLCKTWACQTCDTHRKTHTLSLRHLNLTTPNVKLKARTVNLYCQLQNPGLSTLRCLQCNHTVQVSRTLLCFQSSMIHRVLVFLPQYVMFLRQKITEVREKHWR